MSRAGFETEKDLIKRGVLKKGRTSCGRERFVPKGLLVQWHVTERCNLRCRHCYQTDEPGAELSLREEKNALGQIVKLAAGWNVRGHINFTGGEPFLKKSFPSLLEEASRYRGLLSFAVLTNGTLINDPLARDLARWGCRYVQVSLDGSPRLHNNARGPGHFQKTIQAIKILKRRQLSVSVSFTAHKGNIDTFGYVAEISRKSGADLVWSDRLLPCGRGAEMRDEIMEPRDVEAFFEKMYRTGESWQRRKLGRTAVGMHRALQFLTLYRHGQKNTIPYTCRAGRSLITIMPSGEVLPCRRMPIIVGNLHAKPLKAIYDSSVLFKRLQDTRRIAEGCASCAHARSCNGGLRCLSYAYYGTPFKADPQCFKLHKQLPSQTKGMFHFESPCDKIKP